MSNNGELWDPTAEAMTLLSSNIIPGTAESAPKREDGAAASLTEAEWGPILKGATAKMLRKVRRRGDAREAREARTEQVC